MRARVVTGIFLFLMGHELTDLSSHRTTIAILATPQLKLPISSTANRESEPGSANSEPVWSLFALPVALYPLQGSYWAGHHSRAVLHHHLQSEDSGQTPFVIPKKHRWRKIRPPIDLMGGAGPSVDRQHGIMT